MRTFVNGRWHEGGPQDQPPESAPTSNAWQRVAVGAPIVAGAGVGFKRLMDRGKFPNVNLPRASFLDNFKAQQADFAVSSQTIITNLTGRKEAIDPNLVRLAWEQALQSADPSKIIRRTALDVENPLATINAIGKNNSMHTNRVVKNFARQLESLEKHALSTFASPTNIKFNKASVASFARHEMQIGQLQDPILKDTLFKIQKGLEMIPGAEMNLHMASRPGVDGSQLMVTFTGGRFEGGARLELPMELPNQPGVIVHGTNQQTKRLVGRTRLVDASNRIKSTLNHEQFVARQFYEKVLPKIQHNQRMDGTAIRKMINAFDRDTLEGTTWTNNMPAGILPAHDARVNYASHLVNLVDEQTFDSVDSSRLGSIMSQEGAGLYPGVSGAMLSKGTVTDINPQDYWLGGRAFPFERQPMQGLRRGLSPTPSALSARATDPLRAQYGWLHTDAYLKDFGNNQMDVLADTMYISQKKHQGLADKVFGGVAGGAGAASDAVMDQFASEKAFQQKLGTVSDKLQSILNTHSVDNGVFDFKSPLSAFEPGEILGYDEAGEAVHFDPSMKITGGRLHTDYGKPFLKLHGTELDSPEDYAKVFGGTKSVIKRKSTEQLQDILSREAGINAEGVDAILDMDDLKKNRSLHNAQMLTALQKFTHQNMQRQGKNFDFTTFSKSVQQILASAGGPVYNNEAVIKGVYESARGAQLNPHQMGLTFGVLPEIYGKDWFKQFSAMGVSFSQPEISHIEAGRATGISRLFYGGAPPSGGMGSVEPRFFELLKGQQYGKLGSAMAGDIIARQVMTNPEMVAEQSTLEMALKSVGSGVKPMEGIASYHISGLNKSNINDVLTKGGIVDMGGTIDGVSSLYVPGAEKSAAMREFVTQDGRSSPSELAGSYKDLLRKASMVSSGKRKREVASAALDNLVGELGLAHSGTITGKGSGLARSKVLGSMYSTVVPGTVEQLGDLHTAGIGGKDANRLFDQMKRAYAGNTAELASLAERRKAFFSGGTIGAITARDPDIGPYSIGPQKLRLMEGLPRGHVMFAQQTKILTDASGAEIGRIALGSMAGKAGDYDQDHAHVMLTSSKIEKDVLGHFQSGNHLLAQEEQYIIRQQLLKAKAPLSAGLTLAQEMTAGAEKLALSKEKVGPISTPFAEIRAAISGAQLSPEDYSGSMSLLEAMENIPISGKHVPADKIQLLREQMERLGSAASRGRGTELGSIASEIFASKGDQDISSKILLNEQEVFMDGRRMVLPSVNIQRSGDLIDRLMMDRKSSGYGDMGETRARNLHAGRGTLKRGEISSYLSNPGGLLSDFKMGQKGLGAAISRTRAAVWNGIAAAGGEVIEHAGKPLAIGFGAAIGISALLSAPISNLEPGSGAPPAPQGRVQSANSGGVKPEGLHPDPEVSGEPTAPGMASPSARVSNQQMSARVAVRGTNKNGANVSSLSSIISQRLGQNSTVNVNIRDRKSSLTQQRLDAMMRR